MEIYLVIVFILNVIGIIICNFGILEMLLNDSIIKFIIFFAIGAGVMGLSALPMAAYMG